jgi:hypothetical protein
MPSAAPVSAPKRTTLVHPNLWLGIVESREGAGSFQSVEDLGISANLPPSLVDGIREYAIFL